MPSLLEAYRRTYRTSDVLGGAQRTSGWNSARAAAYPFWIWGAKTTDFPRLGEAKQPAHVAISLMGEPTLYPYLDELIRRLEEEA